MSDSLKPDLTHAQHLLDAGQHLVVLHKYQKRPVGDDWNVGPWVEKIKPSATGYGIPLAINKLQSIDPDHYDMCKVGFAAWGFDLDAILAAGVRTVSTRTNSGGRAAFASDPEEICRWLTFSVFSPDNKSVTVLELRAKSENLQDVVPGLVYADKHTGELCTQCYANGKTLADRPDVPEDFLKFWRLMSIDDGYLDEQSKIFTDAISAAGFKVNGQRIKHLNTLDRKGSALAYPSAYRQPFNTENTVESVLAEHDYIEVGRGRWTYSAATGSPAIRPIPNRDGLWQSSHGGDPLRGTFDAWTAHVQLAYDGDVDAANADMDAKVVSTFDDIQGEPEIDATETPKADTPPSKVHPLAQFIARPEGRLPADEFIIEGVISEKVSMLASYPGLGKSTALVALCFVATGLVKVDGLEVTAPRRVVFVSEHPEQIMGIMQAAAEDLFLDLDEVYDLIRPVNALRMDVAALVRAADDYEALALPVTINGVTVDMKPWVILDTHAATIKMENENDNAEGSKVMSAIKQGFSRRGFPVTICAHTSKQHKRGEAETMTARGASSFEGDVNQMLYLTSDDEGNRFIEVIIPKHRFETKIHSVQVDSKVSTITVVDRFNRIKSQDVRWAVLEPLSTLDRAGIKEGAKEKRTQAEVIQSREAIKAFLIQCEDERKGLSVDELSVRTDLFPTAAVINDGSKFGKREVRREAYKQMKNERFIDVDAPVPDGVNLPGGRGRFVSYIHQKFKQI